uniref:C-type lectin domain-containing protein n=1 Tax=Acrobeloides nanus TaxID=290746 RepID=A0A914DLL2_9BILA
MVLCSKSTFQPTTCPTMPSYNPCPNGYTYHTSTTQCYRIYNGSGLTFDLAENKCKEDGGHLASIHSQEENYFLTDIGFNGNPSATVWIGIHYANNAYQWIDGTAVNYTNWGGEVDTYRFTCGYIHSGYFTDVSGDWFGYWDNNGGCTNTQITYIIWVMWPQDV